MLSYYHVRLILSDRSRAMVPVVFILCAVVSLLAVRDFMFCSVCCLISVFGGFCLTVLGRLLWCCLFFMKHYYHFVWWMLFGHSKTPWSNDFCLSRKAAQ